DRGAFFKSMHGTLNHLLTADQVWMHRFTGQGPSPERLDMIHHDGLAELRRAREAEDKRIVDYIDGLSDAQLAGTIRYRRVSTPEAFEQALAPA
ncbi:DinB family protein, partial [Streptomyces europaeiscabiei]|uniref:DinB family protein n=2 Tax=Bacteria TaxID=2 RepID=UPI0038F6A963